jgi:hypothetical protein
MDRIPHGEIHFYLGTLIQCQSYHNDYVCSCGGVAMLGSEGKDRSTQVPAVRCVWVLVSTSYRAKHLIPLLPEESTAAAILGVEKPLGVATGDPGTYRARSHG